LHIAASVAAADMLIHVVVAEDNHLRLNSGKGKCGAEAPVDKGLQLVC